MTSVVVLGAVSLFGYLCYRIGIEVERERARWRIDWTTRQSQKIGVAQPKAPRMQPLPKHPLTKLDVPVKEEVVPKNREERKQRFEARRVKVTK